MFVDHLARPGDGSRSPGELVRTQQDYPGPVKGLKFEDITDRGVKVLWEKPENPNGIILGYTVRYMVKEQIHTLMEKNLTTEETDFYLTQLKPTTHYTLEVYAWTEVGKGEASIATIQSGNYDNIFKPDSWLLWIYILFEPRPPLSWILLKISN